MDSVQREYDAGSQRRQSSEAAAVATEVIAAVLVEEPDRADSRAALAPPLREMVVCLPESPRAPWLRRWILACGRGAEVFAGAVGIVAALALLAAIPVLQFLSLGYLLEVSGRVARSGRLRDGLVGYRQAARLTGIVAGVWIVLLPLRLAATLRRSALLIDPTSPASRGWTLAVVGLTLLVACHLVLAFWRGGRLRHFLCPCFRPLRLAREALRSNPLPVARDAVWDFVVSLRLPHYFWLGLRGFLGGLAWLVIPVSLLALGGRAPLASWLGALLLAWVLPPLPFLQTRLAVEGRLGAMFERRAVRRLFSQAPLAFGGALLVTLLSALPLYLLKIEMVPREAAWLPSLVFVVFIFPSRLATGWAYGRGERRTEPRHWVSRTLARLGMLPIVALYVLVVFFTQYTAWHGTFSLYEQHAFLLPVPFFGW